MLGFLFSLLAKGPIVFLLGIAITLGPLLISVTIHEWAHGFTAYKFGDPTPKDQGRLTLNPLAHIDPVGALLLLIVGIGWAKPVQINPNYIHGRFKLFLVAFAGPLSNFILGNLFIILGIYLGTKIEASNLYYLGKTLAFHVALVNFMLGLFNLIPIPPLDGSNMLIEILPEPLASAYSKLGTIGMPLIFLFFLFKGFSWILVAAQIIMDYFIKLYQVFPL